MDEPIGSLALESTPVFHNLFELRTISLVKFKIVDCFYNEWHDAARTRKSSSGRSATCPDSISLIDRIPTYCI